MKLYRKVSLTLSLLIITIASFAQSAQVRWVNAQAIALTDSSNYHAALKEQLKNNTILGLGEASHGTHEFFTEKAKLIRYLFNENYRSIGIELGYSLIEPINDHITTGRGNLKQLMSPLRLFNTSEFYDLFEYLKRYNTGKPANQKVTLFGFDTDYIKSDVDSSARYLIAYIKKYPARYRSAQALLPVLEKIAGPALEHLYDLSDGEAGALSDLYNEVSTNTGSTMSTEELGLRKRLSLLYQGTLLGDPLARDRFMAENIIETQHQTQSKTVIWGHNIHIAKDTTMAMCKGMGYYLKQKLGAGYYTIAFDTYKGSVNVLADADVEKHEFETQQASLSSVLTQASYPAFFLKLRNNDSNPLYNVSAYITNIYANWTSTRELPIRPGIDFDAIVFIKETSASMPLK